MEKTKAQIAFEAWASRPITYEPLAEEIENAKRLAIRAQEKVNAFTFAEKLEASHVSNGDADLRIERKTGPKSKATFGTTVHLTSKQAKARVNRSLVSASTVLAERGDMKPRKSPRLETQAITMATNAKRLNAEIEKLRKRMAKAGSDIPLAMLQQLGRKVHKRDILVSRLHSVLAELEKQERTLHIGLTDSHGAPIKRAYATALMPSD